MRHLRRLFPYLERCRTEYAGGLALVVAGSLLAVSIPLVIKAAVDRLEAGNPGGALGRFALVLVGIAAVRSLALFRGRFSIIAASRRVEHDLRDELYRKLLRLPPPHFDRTPSGDLESRVINDVEGVRMLIGVGTMMIVSSGLLAVLSLGSMLALHPRLTAVALAPMILVSVVTALLTRRIYRQSEEVQDRLGGLSSVAQENFTAARVIRAFAREEHENRKFAEASARYREANLALSRTRGWAWGLMAFLIEATIAVTLLAGGLEIIAGRLTKGEFTAFAAYEFMLAWPVIAMGWVVTIWQRGAACMERIARVLDEPEDEEQAPPAALPPARGAIELRGLTFRYAGDRPPALEEVTLSVAPGERIAIVGRTGSGKSTLIQLLLGLYRAPRGTILIDGKDINDYPRAALRDAVGGVAQDAFLFSDKISENIAFGLRDGHEAERVAAAADNARIAPDLARFPDGIHQLIGERGITLSGGQKQRTALARALAREPRVLLLDDALSSVDVDTEREILERLDLLLPGRTCLIVTHRFSVVSKVDRILVFDAGRLVEQGVHQKLMRSGGLYSELVRRQRLEEAIEEA